MNPIHQCGHTRAISVVYGREFQAQAATGLCTPHYGLGPDLPFLDKKIKFHGRTHLPWLPGLNKQTTKAQVANP
jgi:hypothetical protein